MKFLADIIIPQSVIVTLRNLDHDVLDMKKINLLAKDTEIIKQAQEEKRIIITLDKDFIALTQFPRYQTACIVIRLTNLHPKTIVSYLIQFITNQKSDIIENSLTIIRDSAAESYGY